ADHNMPYYTVRALLDGNVKHHDFDPERFREQRALDLMKRVSLQPNPELDDNPDHWDHVKMEVNLKNGQVHRAEVAHPPGTLENPPSDRILVQKFTNMAEGPLGRAKADQAVETILNIDQVGDLDKLIGVITS
ncbi:MAG: hypothetical protein HKN08_02365, partial [Gammaproteobacteria bacterium]|nr:hypothetical protein [Gammaproteobacteria bacterium]